MIKVTAKQQPDIGLAKNGDIMFEHMTIEEIKAYIADYENEIFLLKETLKLKEAE